MGSVFENSNHSTSGVIATRLRSCPIPRTILAREELHGRPFHRRALRSSMLLPWAEPLPPERNDPSRHLDGLHPSSLLVPRAKGTGGHGVTGHRARPHLDDSLVAGCGGDFCSAAGRPLGRSRTSPPASVVGLRMDGCDRGMKNTRRASLHAPHHRASRGRGARPANRTGTTTRRGDCLFMQSSRARCARAHQ